MISGFYLDVADKTKTYKFLIRIIKNYIVWTLFYLPWCYYLDYRFLLVTLFMGFYYLWYLTALIGAIIFIYILRFFIKDDRILLSIALCLYICGYIIQLSIPLNGGIAVYLYRNALFYALPFVIIGNVIKKNIEKIRYNINLIHVIIGLMLILIEGYFYLDPRLNYDMFISAFIVTPLIFIYVLQKGKIVKIDDKNISHIASGIYYIHPAVLMINSKILPQKTNVVFYQFPFMVIVTVFITFLITHVNKTIKIFL